MYLTKHKIHLLHFSFTAIRLLIGSSYLLLLYEWEILPLPGKYQILKCDLPKITLQEIKAFEQDGIICIRNILDNIWVAGLRQKTPRDKPQIYIQKYFDIICLILLIYLGFNHFLAFGVFYLPCAGLRLLFPSKMFKSR